jgi:hypothetical protein
MDYRERLHWLEKEGIAAIGPELRVNGPGFGTFELREGILKELPPHARLEQGVVYVAHEGFDAAELYIFHSGNNTRAGFDPRIATLAVYKREGCHERLPVNRFSFENHLMAKGRRGFLDYLERRSIPWFPQIPLNGTSNQELTSALNELGGKIDMYHMEPRPDVLCSPVERTLKDEGKIGLQARGAVAWHRARQGMTNEPIEISIADIVKSIEKGISS